MKNEQEPVVSVMMPVELRIDDFIEAMVQRGFDDVIDVIKRLEKACEDWEVTEKLYDYFTEEMHVLANLEAEGSHDGR